MLFRLAPCHIFFSYAEKSCSSRGFALVNSLGLSSTYTRCTRQALYNSISLIGLLVLIVDQFHSLQTTIVYLSHVWLNAYNMSSSQKLVTILHIINPWINITTWHVENSMGYWLINNFSSSICCIMSACTVSPSLFEYAPKSSNSKLLFLIQPL